MNFEIDNIILVPFNNCINCDLYNMYQDMPKEDIESINNLNGVRYEEFKIICQSMKKEEMVINPEIMTTTKRYILFVNYIPVREVGIRTTLNGFLLNKGSQIYYKIRLSERKK